MPGKSGKSNRRDGFRALLAYAAPYKRTFVAVVFCSLFALSADLLQPYLIKTVIDEKLLTGSHGISRIFVIGGLYLLLAIIALIFTYLQLNLLQRAGQGIVATLRNDLFRHITRQSMAFFDRHPSGSLVTNESSDTETINQFFTGVLQSLVKDGLSLFLIVGFMFALDAQLALYCLLLFPIILCITILFRRMLRESYKASRSRLSRLIAFLAENLAGMGLIQTFHQEKEQTDRFREHNHLYRRATLKEVRSTVLFNRSFDVLGNLTVAFVVWAGGEAVLKQRLEFGVLYAFIAYIRQFFQPINSITQQWNTLQSTFVSVERLWAIFSREPDVQEPAAESAVRIEEDGMKGRIDFDAIHFSYQPGTEVLHGLDLHLDPGEFVGIVGETGAGKSSLVGLLTRFYDVTSGSVRIDGTDIRMLPQTDLHRFVGLVQQEPFLFSGSIIDNVRLFRPDIAREEAEEACRLVGADRWISRLKHGYDTLLSERGSGLSAGERQLISFARIVVFKPRILILDEATANLDSHTEKMIQQALGVVSVGRTTLVIAHRLSTIQKADRIAVMRDGRIAESGTHKALLALNGYYAGLYRHSQRGKQEPVYHNLDSGEEISR
ncbi:ABC transporter ATP-binding protein [Gorillibacterium timonense]|uniref:ABC transporter ATP-binding protein n=1 Tax=Gorillibacterium timonense TaxID=1689269 RepID=UPI001F2715B5|nr:ABC transporter ATP-binding protein [Gorillibacterium timonense]